MTKERLEELIKQGATIYITNGCELYINKDIAVVCDDKLFFKDVIWWYIKDIFETKEQAVWYGKTYTERTERFDPPMWEDLGDKYIYTFVNGHIEYTFSAIKNKKHYCIGVIEYSLFDGSHNHLIDIEKATKENYIKACEMVRDLFKGEK